MKKILATFATLMTLLMLFLVSCNNATQITFEDEARPKFTEDGYSTLGIKIGKTPDYRTIFPNDWTDEKKSLLLFVLTGEDNKDNGQQTVTTSDKLTGLTTVFTYEEINSGRAVVTLDPIHWNLTLTAYQRKAKVPGAEPIEYVVDDKKPVMQATVNDVDLTTGEKELTFDLTTFNGNHDEGTDLATGELDVYVNFYMNEVEQKLVNKVVLDVVDGGGQSQIKEDSKGDLMLASGAITVNKDDFGESTKNQYSIYMAPQRTVKPGDYQIVVTFYDGKDQIMLQHIENIKIDGGNLTETEINIPEGSFNQPPFAPKNLGYKTWFSPKNEVGSVIENLPNTYDAKQVVIDKADKVYAQKVVNKTNEATKDNYTAVLNAVTKENRYNLELTWEDKSFNESSFIVNLITCDAARATPNDIQLTYNKDGTGNQNKINVLNKPASDYVQADDTGILYVDGGLGPSEESLTISLPVGTFVQDVFVTAVNSMGEGKSLPIANSTLYDDPTTTDKEDQPIQNPLGMFTVAYFLQNPNKTTVAHMKYGPAPATDTVYFIMAYDYGDTDKLITTSPLSYPYVTNDEYVFEGWSYIEGGVGKKVNYLSNLAIKPDPAGGLETDGKLDAGVTNTNIEVVGSWTTPLTVKVTFPTYSEYKKLLSATNQNPYNTIEPIRGADGNEIVTFTTPNPSKDEALITDVKFTIYNPSNVKEIFYQTPPKEPDPSAAIEAAAKLGLAESVPQDNGGTTLTWNTTKFLSNAGTHGDVYRLNISYKYAKHKPNVLGNEPENYLEPVIIDGNFYIKISK